MPLLALLAVAGLEFTQRTNGVGAYQASGIGGPFKLASSSGGELSSDDLKGAPFLVFFGYTHCPDVCPETVSDVSTWLDALGPEGKDVKALFISIDPERDSVASLKDYLSSFSERVIGLTGTPDEIAQVAKEYRVYYAKHPTKDGDYTHGPFGGDLSHGPGRQARRHAHLRREERSGRRQIEAAPGGRVSATGARRPLKALRGRLLWFTADPREAGERARRYVEDGALDRRKRSREPGG